MKKLKVERKTKSLPKERGITLVALVVTIIVLLILAGVTLSLIGGSEGILGRSTHAVDENEKAMAKEQVELAVSDYQTEFFEEKYVEQTENGTKKEYILGKLKGETYTEKYRVVTSEEGKVKVYEKNGVSKNPIVTGNVQEDGSIKWDDEIEVGAPDEPKKENPVTVTLTPEYVGTSSFTIKMNASSTEGNIVSYQYQINGGEVKTTTENTFTMENLEPTTNYTILVVAMDEKGNENKTSIEVTTKARTYIIKNGSEQLNGSLLSATKLQENGYLKISINSTNIRGGYYFSYDLSKYKAIKIDVQVCQMDHVNDHSLWLNIIPNDKEINENDYTTVKWVGISNNNEFEKARDVYNIDISQITGLYKISCNKNQMAQPTKATVYIYNLWLEE